MTGSPGLPGSTVSGVVTWPTLVRMLEGIRGDQKVVVTYYGEAESPRGERVALYHLVAEMPVPLEAYLPLINAPGSDRTHRARDEVPE